MKLLKRGNGWNIKCLCTGDGNGGGGCGSTLLIERGDIYLTHRYDFTGDHEYYYTFKCLVCGVETDIEETSVPNIIRRELLDEYKEKKRKENEALVLARRNN